jgi:hypothetical protein
VLFAAVAAACGENQRVGSEALLDVDEEGNSQRLGAVTPTPVPATPAPLTVGDKPTPTPEPTAGPTPRALVFEIRLVAESPFYEWRGSQDDPFQPGNVFSMPASVELRVVNGDTTAERSKGRSFTDKNGAFHSGMLKPGGEAWTWVFDASGVFEIVDEGLPFANATLEVR